MGGRGEGREGRGRQGGRVGGAGVRERKSGRDSFLGKVRENEQQEYDDVDKKKNT